MENVPNRHFNQSNLETEPLDGVVYVNTKFGTFLWRQIQSASDYVILLESITWDSQAIFLAFTRDQ